MRKITWVDLFAILSEKASGLDNIGKFDWSQEVGTLDEEGTVFFTSSNSLKNTLEQE